MKDREVAIKTEFIRLDAFLKFAGVTQTGGQAKELIEMELVLVDGAPCGQRGKKLYPGAVVHLLLSRIEDDEMEYGDLEFEVVSG